MSNTCRFMALSGLVAAWIAAPAATAAEETHAQLLEQSRVSERVATATALTAVPKGIVKSAELEREHGHLIWSFDIGTPASAAITEVNVDASTGKIIAVHKETPAEEPEEARADKALKPQL